MCWLEVSGFMYQIYWMQQISFLKWPGVFPLRWFINLSWMVLSSSYPATCLGGSREWSGHFQSPWHKAVRRDSKSSKMSSVCLSLQSKSFGPAILMTSGNPMFLMVDFEKKVGRGSNIWWNWKWHWPGCWYHNVMAETVETNYFWV